MHRIINGDILRFAAHYRGNKFHSVLCDPPYELGFMNKSWDSRGISFRAETWSAIGSLLAPGAYLLAFGGTRTFHRIACAIEDAGFEIRDTVGWVYGSGFPKSHDVSKAIDREAGAEREKVKFKPRPGSSGTMAAHGDTRPWIEKSRELGYHEVDSDIPATDAARAWHGYGTALKPAWEPVIVARWPIEGTVAQNVQHYGCGALNINECRIATEDSLGRPQGTMPQPMDWGNKSREGEVFQTEGNPGGRWPANIIHDDSDEIAEAFGGAKRFFYTPKASKRERDEGLSSMPQHKAGSLNMRTDAHSEKNNTNTAPRANHHPTVKPIALTEYLARIVLPPAHIESRILIPFCGSGSECIGALLAGWKHIVGVEQSSEYAEIARARMEYYASKTARQQT